MKHATSSSKVFWLFIVLLSLTGFFLGVYGFSNEHDTPFFDCNNFYDTFQLFILHHSFENKINFIWLECARWVILLVFLLVTFQLFITIIAPRFIQYLKIRFFYRNHTIICGLNAVSMELINKNKGAKMVVITFENNRYIESVKQRKIKFIMGDPTDPFVLKMARIEHAGKLYALTDNDKINLRIAQAAFLCSQNQRKRPEPLQCFTLIKDRRLKILLEESVLFKYKHPTFDGIPFNINEIGVKYGMAAHVAQILPKEMATPPEILFVGLTETTEMALLNLAHCLTMKREPFKFTIVEKNNEKIGAFQKEFAFLQDFVDIRMMNEIAPEKQFDAIVIGIAHQTEAIKQAVEIRYLYGENHQNKNILVLCNEPDTFHDVLKNELKENSIFLINLFTQIADYVFDLDHNIEEKAKEAHYFWNLIYNMDKEWDALSGHFKQSNRNQILDHYLKTYIVFGKKFDEVKNQLVAFSDYDKETLAMMEHRRWMLEKFDNGWVTGERNDAFKRHNCLIYWEQLPKNQQAKDYDTVNLMLKLLNKQSK